MEITIKINIGTEELKELLGQRDKKPAGRVSTLSPYARYFDEESAAWTEDPESNKFFLLRTQNYANEKLRARGYLFLNEVYEMLGMPRTRAGQVVGWVYDPKNPIGDNYVDFGMLNIYSEPARNFMNGLEKSIWLDFNVDGDILNYL